MIAPHNLRWSAEPTVHCDRKNIFAFVGENASHHVGTLVSGSRSKLDRFDADARLAVSAPNLLRALTLADDMLRAWERRNDGADDAQAAFDAFIGAEDSAEAWATIRSALHEARGDQ